ncbi:glycogen/starch/alpha-glucan phosphorylase [Siculibacillus lacustris]|uniref:Alpha-1,4 glucan phosphorylase n=1 Tax=Siculibacillus lacustris TaxID=1549641 RepID=A0A4Q9VHJ1_9HYPH|nr:glycogen/starch/alpha-glucan phosphorylase [Siculibacillus lacustris]TBW33712.1 glycogen/starch/alpha-glucan phosphorylase [Siculibacillus lacustris]
MDQATNGSTPASAGRAARTVDEIREAIVEKLKYGVGKNAITASAHDWFFATALAVRDEVVDRWIESTTRTYRDDDKRVYYLSLEFLIGRLLFDAMGNLEMTDTVREALAGLGVDLDMLKTVEPDAALGNGGLGRLAACFMESMATLSIAAYGYGIRYDHGLFRQRIKDGWQLEYPEDWLAAGNPWEFPRLEVAYPIGFGGWVEALNERDGTVRHEWRPAETVMAIAYDTPIAGWRGQHVNTLRLWSAKAPDPLRLDAFNRGDHVGAAAARVKAEAISKVLYPSDATPAGQELRLRQEFFFASASLQDLIRRHLNQHPKLETLPDKVAIQLNDTHPAIAVAELMRILVDIHDVEWETAWKMTVGTFSYTNHTLLPEALETWPVPLMERLLPRHMQIIYLINALHLDEMKEKGEVDGALLSALSIIDEAGGRRVRMGHLAYLGSHRVNGVSALHSDLMKVTVFNDLNRVYPGRIVNKTNGITFRRWLYQSNPGLTRLLTETIGPAFLDDASRLTDLIPHTSDMAFQQQFAAVKRANKERLARVILDRLEIKVDPDALFDVQIKRIHEYKRQLLNILETVAVYDAMRAQPTRDWIPRVKIFAGKAAASYAQAKLIIKLANDVAKVVNSDPTLRGKLKVVFLPNYNVSLAEQIIPAADLSEQISTAGMEASGTGNMKFGLNGALTIGTLDGANVEMKEHVGDDNIFIFGLTTEEVAKHRAFGIDSRETIAKSAILAEVLDAIGSGVFSPGEPDRYKPLVDALTYHDYFMVTADFESYYATQRAVFRKWRDKAAWRQSAALNTANMGWFSSDRTISEYAEDIWNVSVRPPHG